MRYPAPKNMIERLQKEAKMSRKQIAVRVGVTHKAVGHWYTGESGVRLGNLRKLQTLYWEKIRQVERREEAEKDLEKRVEERNQAEAEAIKNEIAELEAAQAAQKAAEEAYHRRVVEIIYKVSNLSEGDTEALETILASDLQKLANVAELFGK